MAFFRALAIALLVAVDGCIFFSSPSDRPPVDAGGFDQCIASLDPWGRQCCLDPGTGQCR